MRYARREHEFRPSPVRAVFELALDPRFVSLAGGNPDTALLPHEEIAEISARLLRDRGAEILQYGSGAGIAALPEVIGALMAAQGAQVSPRELLITTGSQMGIDLATKLLCDPGDLVVAEGPTYVGAMGVFGAYETELRQIPVDDDGLVPQALEEALDAAQREGRRVGYLYTIPHHQNPSGTTLSQPRREQVVEICARRGVPIVEDDPYALVGFPGTEPLASLYSLNPAGVVHLGSFSKIFSPGMRVGWMAAPPQVRDRLQIAGESVDIHPSVLAQEIVAAYVGTPSWSEHLGRLRQAYAGRCQGLLEALARHAPEGVRWTVPSGGFFTWVTLEGVDPGADILGAAIERELIVVPGRACFAGEPPAACLRLAYSGSSPQALQEGARRLAQVIDDLRQAHPA
ncbi:aminotransferase-like domain-containing protein [Actinomyces bowdenii]|uniref:PLP-dependent aminotransferase family protein n=1 Tax=Actinomyces bowdenii TaxID=131109 RepID=A0A853EG72_9ACTO|nr:PLP-dependent aminotransferase family protein [Actinomyces bowdenii]MBF0696240.1 PLP-dependent aminotransferase family protein [Actinomyces bowdenii]NYS68413.1 PLP-dependent aminotransferase family protein [Actinomyces bowdenii]